MWIFGRVVEPPQHFLIAVPCVQRPRCRSDATDEKWSTFHATGQGDEVPSWTQRFVQLATLGEPFCVDWVVETAPEARWIIPFTGKYSSKQTYHILQKGYKRIFFDLKNESPL